MSLEKIAEKLVKMVFTDFSHIDFVDSASKSSSKTELLKFWSHHLNDFFTTVKCPLRNGILVFNFRAEISCEKSHKSAQRSTEG